MSFTFSELFSYFGSLLGIIVSMIIFTKMQGKKEIRISLALSILVASVTVILGALMYSGKTGSVPHLIRIESPIHYLFPPACLFYTYSSFNANFRFRWIHLLHLLPFFINIIEFLPFYLSSPEEKVKFYYGLVEGGSVIIPLHYLFKTISVIAYFALQVLYFLKFRQKVADDGQKSLFLWFWIFLSGQLMLGLGFLTDHITGLNLFEDPYRYAITMVTLFLYTSTIALLFFPDLLYGYLTSQKRSVEKYSRSLLNENNKNEILERFITFLQDQSKPWLNSKLSLQDASRVINVPPKELSQVINEKTLLNFNDHINFYRIEEAKHILASDEVNRMTIDAIALKAGFNSKSPFYQAFKKHTGMTPKQFISDQHVAKPAC